MNTWKINVMLDLFAMLLELPRIVPNDLKITHYLIVTCLILMTLNLVCLRKYVYSCCLKPLDLKTCLKRDITNCLLEVKNTDNRNNL